MTVHGTVYKIPCERLAVGKGYLKSFEILAAPFILGERQASRTGLFSVEGSKYSVPAYFAGRESLNVSVLRRLLTSL